MLYRGAHGTNRRVRVVSATVRERVALLALAFSPYGIDPYGIDKRALAEYFSRSEWLYHNYFDVLVVGAEHVPASGRAMLVGNHSGGVALDGAIVIASGFFELEPPRLIHAMLDRFLASLPGVSRLLCRVGQFTGLPEHAVRLLEDDRLLLVFPEGARGTAKLASQAHTLVRFGTGFMRLAMATRSPVVPFAFLGGGEAIPTVRNLYGLGKLLGVPYVPVTRYVLPLPRPARLTLIYGEPMRFEGTGREPDDEVLEHVERVRARIARLLEQGAALRAGRLRESEIAFG